MDEDDIIDEFWRIYFNQQDTVQRATEWRELGDQHGVKFSLSTRTDEVLGTFPVMYMVKVTCDSGCDD